MVSRSAIVKKQNKHRNAYGLMHKNALVFLCLFLLLTACQYELFTDYEPKIQEGTIGEVEEGSSSLVFTRAAANDGNMLNRVKTLRILIFDAVTGQLVRYSDVDGIKVNNQRFPESGSFSDEQDIELILNTAPGTRNIYFVANEDSDPQLATALNSNTLTRSVFLGLTATYNPNVIVDGQTPFLMTGQVLGLTIKPYTTSDLLVELIRTYSKVSVNFIVDDAILQPVVNAASPSAVVTSPSRRTYYYTKGSAPAFITIDEISLQVPQKYYLINNEVHANQSFDYSTYEPSTTSISGSWIFGRRQYRSKNSWNTATPYSLSFSFDTVLHCTATFYIPEYQAQNPNNEQDALILSFKLSRLSYEEPSYPSGATVYSNYASSGRTAYTMDAPQTLSSTRTYTTPLYTQYSGQESASYTIPRNHEYIVNASLGSWTADALKVKAGVQHWNQESIDIEMAPVNYDWGYWLDEFTVNAFGTPQGEQHSGTVRYGSPLYFGLKMVGPIGKPWRVTLSDGFSFQFTDDSQTAGTTTRDGGTTYIKFGVMPVFPYESTLLRNTEIRVLVDDVIVESGKYRLTQVE